MKRVLLYLAVIVCLVCLGDGQLYAAPLDQQNQNKCSISSPTSGSQLRGQVVIAGSATHADFTWYQMGYAPDPSPDGRFEFFVSSETAVTNGRLGVWNTAEVPDGVYQLVLEVHRKDGGLDLCFVKQLRVNNSAPTPTFTAAALPTAAETPTQLPTSVPENTPTVVIEQPPTMTPRPTPTWSPVDNPTPTPEMTRFKLPIDPAAIRDASCRGAQLAILAAVVVALYFIIRNVMISGVRKVWRPRDVEGFHTRRPRHD